jgi:dGTPase
VGEKSEWIERRSSTKAQRALSEWRDDYGRDRARVVHSAGFRRLQAKTQVLGIGEGDFHRTRLTHSMEAAQLGRGIVRALEQNHLKKGRPANHAEWDRWLPSLNLIETIALAHDLGHPPFGHGGEVALHYAMREAGGFEGNGQTLRLLARQEAHTDGYGLDLTRRSLLGVLKYPVTYETVVRRKFPQVTKQVNLRRDDWKPPKSYMATEKDIVDWILLPFSPEERATFVMLLKVPKDNEHGKSKYHSLDTAIMEIADDIAYGVHDLEDAIALRLITPKDLESAFANIDETWARRVQLWPAKTVLDALFSESGHQRKFMFGGVVNAFIVSVEPYELSEFQHPLLRLQVRLGEPAARQLKALQDLVTAKVIKTPQVQTVEYRGQQLIVSMFEAIASDPKRLLKENFRKVWEAAGTDGDKLRVICDYIAGMTDEYATRMYERLFVPRQGHIFDRL